MMLVRMLAMLGEMLARMLTRMPHVMHTGLFACLLCLGREMLARMLARMLTACWLVRTYHMMLIRITCLRFLTLTSTFYE